MTAERPPRLKESAELGPLLRAVEPPAISPERLAANAAGVRQRIAAGVTTVAVWKVVVALAVVLAVLVPLAWWLLRGEAHERAPAGRDAATGSVLAGERELGATTATAPAIEPGTGAATAPAIEPGTATETDAAIAIEPGTATETDLGTATDPATAEPATAPAHAVREPRGSAGHHAEHLAPDAGLAAPLDAEPAPTSDLPEQIRIYEAARDASRRGDFDGALAQLDELVRRFPATQLRADAELTRADVLARAGRLAEAAQAFEMLVADPVHRGRRGELLRTLGDIYRKLDDCPHALAAYTRAQAEHLTERDRAAVARGRGRCE